MTAREFYDAVHADPELEWLGTFDRKSRVIFILAGGNTILDIKPAMVSVRNTTTGLHHEIDLKDIKEHAWFEFDGIFKGLRPVRVMTHIARIVGYFSFMHVWNPSKIAEAKDRAKGNYGVEEAA